MKIINHVRFLHSGMRNRVYHSHALQCSVLCSYKLIFDTKKLEIVMNLLLYLPRIWESQIEQHEEVFFSWPEMMRNAEAQQSCRHLTPLLSGAGENPIHFQLLYLLTVDPVSKHRGQSIQPNTHTFSFHNTLGFNYLGGSVKGGVEGQKWHKTTFKS